MLFWRRDAAPGGRRNLGVDTMRKTAVLVALAMAVSGPAFAAKKAKPEAKPVETQGEKDLRLVKGFLPLLLPTGLQAVYFTVKPDQYK
jgi:hypothetical protein